MNSKISRNTLKIINNETNEIILLNSEKGQWMRLSLEVYKYILSALENKTSLKEILDEEDFLFIIETIEELSLIGVIIEKEEENKIENISVEITDKCNLFCKHCCMNALRKNSVDSKELETKDLLKLMKHIIELKPKSIMISGGEPMLRKDFMEISKYIRRKYEGELILSTNGTFINKFNSKELSEIYDRFEISIDGINEETTSAIRGKNVFAKVMNAVELLKGYNCKIYLSMVFGDKNEHLKKDFFDLNKYLGTIPHERGFFRIGRAIENYEILLTEENKNVYIPKSYISQKIITGVSCKALKKMLMIRCNGDIYPCPSLMEGDFFLGNILEINKTEIRKGVNYVEKFLEKLQKEKYLLKECKMCKLKYFCWTCPGEALEYKKNEKVLKERCSKVKNNLNEKVWGIFDDSNNLVN